MGRVIALAIVTLVIISLIAIASASLRAESGALYRVPITIVERSGNDVYNYSIKVVLNASNFPYLIHVSPNATDIYFTDAEGRPLYYWIESVSNTYSVTPVPRGDQNSGVYWRYVHDVAVPSDWYSPSFNDSSWSLGEAPIGDTGPYRTYLDFTDLYVRKVVTIPSVVTINGIEYKVVKIVKAVLKIASDDGADAWVNGYQVLSGLSDQHAYSYWNYQIDVTQYVQIGNNTIAIHVHDYGGYNYFDAELNVVLELDHPISITAWVKIPHIPANGDVTIYMYYGGANPYANFNDPSNVFLWFLDEKNFRSGDLVSGTWQITLLDNSIKFVKTSSSTDWENYWYRVDVTPPVEIVIKVLSSTNQDAIHVALIDVEGSPDRVQFFLGRDDGAYTLFPTGFGFRYVYDVGGNGWDGGGGLGDAQTNTWYYLKMRVFSDKVELYGLQNTTLSLSIGDNPTIYVGVGSKSALSYVLWDYVFARRIVVPEPEVILGSEEPAKVVRLPLASMFLVHDVVYSPNATQFSYSFTASNASTAGYEAPFGDAYGWRVYAEPYAVNGTLYENSASLVSEVNVTLPYAGAVVENVTLLVRVNGTGSYRQLWIKVLNSSGAVIAELVNASMGSSWGEVTLTVNASPGTQLTLWINATVKSTVSAGEEIDVKDVRIYVEYSANPEVDVYFLPNVESFNCTARFLVRLGSVEYLNSSTITFGLIQYLRYNSTSYPVQPVYVGNETLGGYSYSVYRVDPANYSQYLTVYATLPNEMETFRTRVKGLDTDRVLVGEPLTIELPTVGNVTVFGPNGYEETFVNVSELSMRFSVPGTYVIVANSTKLGLWRLGYALKTIRVGYGSLTVKPIDLDSKTVDYEGLVMELIDSVSGAVVRKLSGNEAFPLDGLRAGNYTVLIEFEGVVVGATHVELNVTTNGSVISVPCAMKILPRDYRGYNRSLILELGTELLNIESLSSEFPYSRTMILVRGSGPFELIIDYRGRAPTRVEISSNVTDLWYYWSGSYLVVKGILSGAGVINVTDLYGLRVELYDRLGHALPLSAVVTVNGTGIGGPLASTYVPPGTYVVEVPTSVGGFELYRFAGFNGSAGIVTVNCSDVALRAWYRVPTRIENLGGVRIARVLWLPFVMENETAVYVEGYLRDYYGEGVPNRPVTIEIVDTASGYRATYNVTTDPSGYFELGPLELLSDHTYRVVVRFGGDDVYVGTSSSIEVKPSELPTRYAISLSLEQILLIVTGIVVVAATVAAVRSARHVIERVAARRFVTRR